MKATKFLMWIAVLLFTNLGAAAGASANDKFGSNDALQYFEGPVMTLEGDLNSPYNGMIFTLIGGGEAVLSSNRVYADDNPGLGGLYYGELDVPAIYIDEYENEQYTVTGVNGFFRNGVTVLRLPETITKCHTIVSCSLLREVYLNDNLKEFSGIVDCPRLTVCPLPSALEHVGENSMSGIGVREIEFPPLLTSVGDKTFCRNYDLEYLDLGNIETIGDTCFNRLPMLKEITLPETLVTMGKECFRYCFGVETVNLPSHEIAIDFGSFAGCHQVKTVTVAAETPYPLPYFLEYDNQVYEVTVYVPDGSVDAYKNAGGWCKHTILPMSQSSSIGWLEAGQPEGWTAYSSKGQLKVWSDTDRVITVINNDGQNVATVRKQGDTTLSLPKGIYHLCSDGCTIKAIVK